VPFKVTAPPDVVRTPPDPNVIPEFAPLAVPFAVKFIAVKLDVLVFVIAAVIEIKDAAVSVNVVAAVQVLLAPTAAVTEIDPEFGPEPEDPTVVMVTLPWARFCTRPKGAEALLTLILQVAGVAAVGE
jgi:hypothetical protein